MTKEDRAALRFAIIAATETLQEAAKRVSAEQDHETARLLILFAAQAENIAELGDRL